MQAKSTQNIGKIIIGVLVLVLIIGVFYYTNNNSIEFELSDEAKNTITLEYGSIISENALDYLDMNKVDETIANETIVTIKSSTNDDENTESNDYQDVGNYVVTLTYNDLLLNVNVEIVDTTAPEFIDLRDEYEVTFDDKLTIDDFEATDLSNDITITIDDNDVDYTKEGTYIATITASDPYDNSSSQEISVIVVVDEDNDDESSDNDSSDSDSSSTSIEFIDCDETVYVVNTSSLNVRKGPGTNYSTIGTLSKGTSVKRTGTSREGWSRITYNGTVAYVSSKYLSTTKPTSSSSSSSTTTSSGFDVSSLKVASTTTKIIIVTANSSSSSSGTFAYYEKSNGTWTKVISTSAALGRNGINKTKEGDGKTPTGLYKFSKLMGIASNPGTIMSYTKITNTMYWCGTTAAYYNQLIDESTQTHNCDKSNDEHLIDYTNAYKYLAVINYNSSNTYNKGSAIFLHCKTGSSTAGCVAISESYMKQMMTKIDSTTVIIIDIASNINSSNY